LVVDELLAHITTIEAALGLRADYQKSFRIEPDRHKGMRAITRCEAASRGFSAIAAMTPAIGGCT
jgi:hypothetical protein